MIVTIDPSIRRLGFAVFNEHGRLRGYKLIAPKFDPGKCKVKWQRRAKDMVDHVMHEALSPIIDGTRCRFIVCEMPQMFMSDRGKKARESEAIQKLYFFVGALMSAATIAKVMVILVTPSSWKGNIPKATTLRRVVRQYGVSAATDHNVIDAIGIGYWWFKKGYLKRSLYAIQT